MPELPEVETIRRHLARVLPGQTIAQVDLRLPKLVQPAEGLALTDLVGRQIERVERCAKLLLIAVSDGLSLIIHLKLTGQLVFEGPDGVRRAGGHPVPAFDVPLPHKSTHLIITFASGGRLYLTDIRQFGLVRLVASGTVPALLSAEGYGPDALDPSLTPVALGERLMRQPRARLKPVLLDQTVLAGLGNIYVDEALFSAQLHPLRTPASLTPAELSALLAGIRDALAHGLEQGGFAIINGRARPLDGYPRVHGLAGTVCPRCGAIVTKTTVGGRGTYLCPGCQLMPGSTPT
ncbi:MAG: formamidopyrimidine-DNA glycosylase [Chloroflexi bacterium]|nr:formamidopyrimidine-DNA glycosylase [Chloroflexota bacterium]